MITQLLKRKIMSDAAYARLGQWVYFVAACILPVLVLRKFSTMDMSEAQLLVGVIATMSFALLCAMFGVLLGMYKKLALRPS